MGRKRWWRGGLELLLLLSILHHAILADGDVGCLFSKSLCNSRTETCYNDLAFGRCIPLYNDFAEEELYRYNLDPEELELLRLQLEKLEVEGYKWPHPYTQCIMQMSLYNFRYGLKHDVRLCNRLKNHDGYRFHEKEYDDFDDVLRAEGHEQPIAIVKFTPSSDNPHGEFADELYYPPGVREDYTRLSEEKDYSPYGDRSRKFKYQIYRPKLDYGDYDLPTSAFFEDRRPRKGSLTLSDLDEPPTQPEVHQRASSRTYTKRGIDSLKELLEEDRVIRKLEEDADDLDILPNEGTQIGSSFGKHLDLNTNGDVYVDDLFEKTKYPKTLSVDHQEDDDDYLSWRTNRKRESNDNYEKEEEEPGENVDETVELAINDGLYTEGGLAEPRTPNGYNAEKEDEDPYDILTEDELELLLKKQLAGFKRRERLDVKKPGPPFSTNNYAFKNQASQNILPNDDLSQQSQKNDILLAPLVKKELPSEIQSTIDSRKIYNNVDMDHVYIEFQQDIHTWAEGERIVEEINLLLGLTKKALRDVRVGRAEITFTVGRNNRHFNATDVVNSIEDIREKLKDSLGVEVYRAGLGDKTKLPAIFQVSRESEMSSSIFGAIVAASVAAAGSAAVVTLIIARRHAKSRAKLAGLTTPDPEASKDYQELCRARMQAKQQPSEKVESPRIINLSRESESNGSPSNRSSTSSWSEEPTLSNMDISTGHMVLSYMEDHFKNRNRLDQEWDALSSYEAHPASIEIAKSSANAKYNRPGAALPYDHSRIVLNVLGNANETDYINASTIMDHDPRNPAYIATQGPTRDTAADFWQLVWEQGSVVIVILTRLSEDGRAMCYRYWPQEDSEHYHIYEVHHVSEHFWCDDYLVRSFYLKNLRTGETRTVTQFHFLSWPENGVPQSTKALLEFRRKINKSYRGRSCPIVVHCSDGAGRTGTYCLIDMVLNRMAKGAKEIDIAATLEHIRDQRPHMVATKQQFEFVLMAVAEEVHAILKALPPLAPSTIEKSQAAPSTNSTTSIADEE